MSRRKKLFGIGMAVIVILMVGGFVFAAGKTSPKATGEGLTIKKSEVTKKAKFYPIKVGKTSMEAFAVKASDGTIRVALNTCQVCFDSGRGFYTQVGEELICNNCGNRFHVDAIGDTRFGCNPIPVPKDSLKDTGDYLVVSQAFLEKSTPYFARWKR